jgi:hypothetical protein
VRRDFELRLPEEHGACHLRTATSDASENHAREGQSTLLPSSHNWSARRG